MWQRLSRGLTRASHRHKLREDFQSQKFRRTNERPVEYAFAFAALGETQPTHVLDIGTGRSALPALMRTCGFVVTATDNVRDYWPRGMFNHHWHVVDDDIMASRLKPEHYDAITCISVLEHITDPVKAVAGMRGLLHPGGTLILTTPFGGVGHENVYTRADSYGRDNSYPCRQSSPADLDRWLALGFGLKSVEYWQFFEGSDYWSCGALLRPPRRSDQPTHLGCFVLSRTD